MNFKNFDNFDPDADSFDPDSDNLDGQPQKMVRQTSKAYFDLSFTNSSEHNQVVELFSALNSFTFNRQNAYLPTAGTNYADYTLQPLSSRQGFDAHLNNTVPVGNRTPANESTTDKGFVGFDNAGGLIITGAGADSAEPLIKVQCKQTPYYGLFESSKTVPFRITRIRMTVTTDGQIDNAITHFTKNFLGAASQNDVNPRNFFSPQQYQGKIIDIPVNFKIDGNRGIYYTLNSGETVTWNLEIEQYNWLTVGSVQ